MGYEFVLHRRASKQLSKLPTDVDERIQRKLREMVTNEFRDLLDYDVEPVAGAKYDIYRSRIGAYRVFFTLDGETVAILHVDDRDGAYRDVTALEGRVDDYRP